MPTRKPFAKYSKGQYQLKVPFVMYPDFESLLTKPSEEEEKRGIVNTHVPLGWCIKSEFAYGEVDNPIKMYRGKDCIEKFCNYIISEAKRLYGSFPEHWKNINKSYYENILVFKNHNFSGTIIWLFCRKNQIMIFFYEIINRS